MFVTDKTGEPITGLTRDDFVVLSDGRPTEVTNFYVVENGRERANDADAANVAAPAPEREPSLALSPEVESEHRLWMIVYIDNYNINSIERNRVFPAVRHFLGTSLRPGDKAMLVTYNRKLEVREPFTDRMSVLQDALDELEDDSGFAAVRRRELMSTLKRIDEANSPSAALLYARNYAEEQMNGVQYTTDALERLINSLGGLPGRKALVHVSSGIPMLAGEAAFEAIGEKFGSSDAYAEIPRHDTSRSFERINRHANAHRVAFYTVDAGGLRGLEFGNAEYGGFVNPKLRRLLDSVVPGKPPVAVALHGAGNRRPGDRQSERDPAGARRGGGRLQNVLFPGHLLDRYRKRQVPQDRGQAPRATQGRTLTPPRRLPQQEHRHPRAGEPALRPALLSRVQSGQRESDLGAPRKPHGEDGHYLLPIQLHIPLRDVVLLPTATGQHELRLRPLRRRRGRGR